MSDVQPKWLTFEEIRIRQRSSAVRVAEVPVEHAVSFPLPTLRFGAAAYAAFAAPALRPTDGPAEQGVPDRWWAVDAVAGRLVVYALWQAIPFAEGVAWSPVTLPSLNRSVAEVRKLIADLEGRVAGLAPRFFASEPGDAEARRGLLRALAEFLPAPLQPQYRALVPDFFAWLEA